MAVVMLVATDPSGPVVGTDVADRLREIGVTRVSFLRDAEMTGVVLEGWAFDPAQVGQAARAIFPGNASVRTLHEIAQVSMPDTTPSDRARSANVRAR